ncbi:MAG TPA: TraR/DksA C4-type zinc finger protein [Bryobacteraceae bacterium]|nr:TraR/DksA C4-type zinc finger protein [Bryobacteraceae bacterium]
MTSTDLDRFRALLKAKQKELTGKWRSLESIAIERSPDLFDEIQYKSDRELAIIDLNRESALRRDVELALIRIHDGVFGACMHCDVEISTRRLHAVPWAPFCVRCQEDADRGDENVLESIGAILPDAA